MSKTPSRYIALGLLSLSLIGCGQAPPPPAPDKAPVALTPTPPTDAAGETKSTPSQNTTATTPPIKPVAADGKSKSAASFPEAKFLGEDVVGLVVIHPRRLHESALYKTLRDAGLTTDFERQVADVNIKPETIERATLVIDQGTVNKTAKASGLEVADEDGVPQKVNVANNLKEVGLAMLNYEGAYNTLPRADGDGGVGNRTGLSWRVHLLAFSSEFNLYNEFHMDEPWDSDHNKTLIEKMPALYESPGVTENGKTSLHVFIGEKTPFHGDKGTPLSAFSDGTSATLLAVMAGPDTAEIWTKPGGLTFDAAAPKKSLGKVGENVSVVMADGAVGKLSMTIPDAALANMIQLNDGNQVSIDKYLKPSATSSAPVPTVIVSLAGGADRQAIIDQIAPGSEEEAYEGQKLHRNERAAVCFVDDKTALIGAPDAVKKLIDASKTGGASNLSVVKQIATDADFAVAIDLKPQTALLDQTSLLNDSLSMLKEIHGASLQINLTGKPGDKLVELVATVVNAQTAAAITDLAKPNLMQVQTLMQLAPPMEDPNEKRMQQFVQKIAQSANLQQVGERIEFAIPVPDDFDKVTEILKPAIGKATKAAAQTQKKNNMKMIGLAFHNYHDTNSSFPGAGRAATATGKKGLSWRVHLLPFVDQGSLYNKFNFDEPWDSETNKALIDQMPDVYKTDGVTEAGKTAIHVFTGAGAPFADDQAPGLREFTDGSSNTILAVSAGPDTAEIWTKPGGLDFDPENPMKAMGKLGETFLVLFADGSVRAISPTIKPENLRRLIQSADGEPITDEF